MALPPGARAQTSEPQESGTGLLYGKSCPLHGTFNKLFTLKRTGKGAEGGGLVRRL